MLDDSCRTNLCVTGDFVANGAVTALLPHSVTTSRAVPGAMPSSSSMKKRRGNVPGLMRNADWS
jgi:hypothetical protein